MIIVCETETTKMASLRTTGPTTVSVLLTNFSIHVHRGNTANVIILLHMGTEKISRISFEVTYSLK